MFADLLCPGGHIVNELQQDSGAQPEARGWLTVHGRIEDSHVSQGGPPVTLCSINNYSALFSHRDAQLQAGPCPPELLWGAKSRSLEGNNAIMTHEAHRAWFFIFFEGGHARQEKARRRGWRGAR